MKRCDVVILTAVLAENVAVCEEFGDEVDGRRRRRRLVHVAEQFGSSELPLSVRGKHYTMSDPSLLVVDLLQLSNFHSTSKMNIIHRLSYSLLIVYNSELPLGVRLSLDLLVRVRHHRN